jgi:hypothetical protein
LPLIIVAKPKMQIQEFILDKWGRFVIGGKENVGLWLTAFLTEQRRL